VRGGTREARLRFPDDHRNEALRGRSATVTVTLGEVKEKVLPDLDDGFAKTVSPLETLAALREEIRQDLEARRARENRRALEEAVVDVLLASHEVPGPEALVLRQVGHTVGHARERLRQQGLDPDRVPLDYPKLLEELRPGAERAVRRALLLEAIAAREGIEPTEADVDAEVARLAEAAGRPAPALRRAMEQRGDLDALRLSLREARTLDFLIERAQITS
jgi:trigger factor